MKRERKPKIPAWMTSKLSFYLPYLSSSDHCG